MSDHTLCHGPGVSTCETVRWVQTQQLPAHTLPLGRVLELLAPADEQRAVERLLHFLGSTIGAGPAVATEYVLHGGVLKLRRAVPAAGRGSHDVGGSIADPAHGQLIALARGDDDDAVFGMRSSVDAQADWPPLAPGKAALRERVSVLYTIAPKTAWAMHFIACEPATQRGHDVLSVLSDCALLVREVHRIVSPAAADLGERVESAAVRLGVRAASLSGRERQICARIAGGRSAASIAAELGIAASTVMTLRKRAYAKLGIHDRLDLRHLAA